MYIGKQYNVIFILICRIQLNVIHLLLLSTIIKDGTDNGCCYWFIDVNTVEDIEEETSVELCTQMKPTKVRKRHIRRYIIPSSIVHINSRKTCR